MTMAAAAGGCAFRRSPGGAPVDQRAREEIAAALLGAYGPGRPTAGRALHQPRVGLPSLIHNGPWRLPRPEATLGSAPTAIPTLRTSRMDISGIPVMKVVVRYVK